MNKRIVVTILLFILVVAGALFWVQPGVAANCFMASPQLGFVCDARAVLPTFTAPEPRADSILSRYTYSWIDDYAPFSADPSPSAPVVGNAGVGFLYSTIQGAATDEQGTRWFKVPGGWTPSGYVHIVEGTKFTGVIVNQEPERPFGWMLDKWQPRPAPGASAPRSTPLLERYDFVEIYDAVRAEDGWIWYDIGGGRWVKDNYVAVADVSPRPAGVSARDYWVEVDLTEQVLTAYEGNQMVYATVVSTGLDRWPTRQGLFQVWDRHLSAPMSGGEAGDDFYNIQHVPHTMFFDDGISLHGAFWHNSFGLQKSHGCVNMPPRDAEWVFFWSANAPSDLWVNVVANEPDHFLQLYAPATEAGTVLGQ